MPEAATPLVAEGAVAGTMTAAEIAAAEAAAAAAAEAATAAAVEQAAAQAAAEQAATQAAGQAAQTATNQSVLDAVNLNPVSPSGGGLADLAVNTYTGPGSMSNFGEVVNPFEAPPPAAPPVAGPPAAPPVAPTAPPPAPPAMPPSNYGYTGAPPAEPLVESAATTPVNPSNPVQATSTPLRTSGGFDTAGFENLSGIQALANEVGATSAFNTPASTLTQYGAGAPTSTLPTTFNPAAPMANPTYAQSGLQGLQTNLSGPLGSNLPPPSVTQAVNPVGADQFTQMQVRGALTGEGMNPGVYQEAVAKTPFSPVGSTPAQVAGNVSNFGANTLQPFETTPEYADAMKEAYRGMEPVKAVSGETIYPQTIGSGALAPEVGGLQSAWQDFTKMSLPNKLMTGMLASSAYEMLNRPKPYEKEKYKSTWNGSNYTGYQPVQPTPYRPNYAHGGLADLGGYSDYARGGRMLKGPGDGMSDDIPATIANKQPARLANEEFVVPADVVSHLGNGSSEAGAKVLYKMMDRVRQARTGNKKQGKQINPEKYLA